MYIKRVYFLLSIKLFIKLVRQFNLFINKIFILLFDTLVMLDKTKLMKASKIRFKKEEN